MAGWHRSESAVGRAKDMAFFRCRTAFDLDDLFEPEYREDWLLLPTSQPLDVTATRDRLRLNR